MGQLPLLMLPLILGMDTMVILTDITEDTTDTDTLTVTTEARGPLRQNPKLLLLPTPKLRLVLRPGTDITTVMDLDTMVDTTDILTIMDTIILERGLLKPNLRQKPKPMPNLGDITVTLTDTDTIEDTTDTLMAVTTMASKFLLEKKIRNFLPF